MQRLTDQTVNQDEFVGGPAYRRDSLYDDAAVVVQQGDVRRIGWFAPAPQARLRHCHAKRLLERRDCGEAVAAAQNKGPVAWGVLQKLAARSKDMSKGRSNGCRCGLARHGNNALLQPGVVAKVMQPDMKTLLFERRSAQTMFCAQLQRQPGDARGGIGASGKIAKNSRSVGLGAVSKPGGDDCPGIRSAFHSHSIVNGRSRLRGNARGFAALECVDTDSSTVAVGGLVEHAIGASEDIGGRKRPTKGKNGGTRHTLTVSGGRLAPL
jgi:hypothetical protein